ncbi:MAG TPA: ABC transporter permease [Vicinamibacterales bacterium]|nr:ABC transporter permease [Vicinamibacterales bacterium]
MRRYLNRLRWLALRRRHEDEIREELRFHLEQEIDEGRAAGLNDDQARRAARLELGNPAVLEEAIRGARGWAWIGRMGQDVRYARRLLRRRPAFSLAAIVTLALGIGGATAMFSLYDALIVRHLPVAAPGELVRLVEHRADVPYTFEAFTLATHDTLRPAARALSGVFAGADVSRAGDIDIDGERRSAVVQLVSDNFFDVLGVRALGGQVFHEPGPAPGDAPIAVLSADYWRIQYAGSPSAIGSRFRRGSREFTVVGIAARGFRGIDIDTPVDIWVPIDQLVAPDDRDRVRGRWMRIMGRLAPGMTPAQASLEASAILGRRVQFVPGAVGYSTLRQTLSRPLLLVSLVVAVVLLIACANLANLMLASAVARGRELAVRAAIGASRARIVWQLLTEGFVLSAIGGVLGIGVAHWISGALLAYLPPDDALALPNLRLVLDARVLIFATLLTGGTALLFGFAPALRSTGHIVPGDLKSGAGSGEAGRSWLRRGLLVSQVAMCTALLIVAGVFLRTLQNLRGQDAGYIEDRLLVADVRPPGTDDDQRDEKLELLRDRIAALPGVEVAAFSNVGQLAGAIEFNIGFPGGPERFPMIEQRITPGFLRAMGNSIVAGRDFTPSDHARAPLVAIVNESFAERFFPGNDPLGRRFFRDSGTFAGEPMEIVGVVKDSKWISLRDEAPAMYYRPYRQMGGTPIVRFAIRTSSDPRPVAGQLHSVARSIDPGLVLANVVPFSRIVDRTLVIERLVAQVSTAFGVLALLIATVGLYGVMAYSVARRRREIGIRLAVGARPRAIEWMFLRESIALVALGVALGLPGAIAVTRLVSSMLFGLGPQDPASIAGALLVLVAATVAAGSVPARRAAGVDPILALREE